MGLSITNSIVEDSCYLAGSMYASTGQIVYGFDVAISINKTNYQNVEWDESLLKTEIEKVSF